MRHADNRIWERSYERAQLLRDTVWFDFWEFVDCDGAKTECCTGWTDENGFRVDTALPDMDCQAGVVLDHGECMLGLYGGREEKSRLHNAEIDSNDEKKADFHQPHRDPWQVI
jgi:hypothetical protein